MAQTHEAQEGSQEAAQTGQAGTDRMAKARAARRERESPYPVEKLEKFRKFAQEYVMHGNGTRAAIAVGYAKSSAGDMARRLLARDDVQQILTEEREALRNRNRLSMDMVVAGLLKEARDSTSASGRVKAWEALARIVKDDKGRDGGDVPADLFASVLADESDSNPAQVGDGLEPDTDDTDGEDDDQDDEEWPLA